MTSEIWYKSYRSRHDYTCIWNYQILCTCVVSTGSEAYGMNLPLHLQPSQEAVVCQTLSQDINSGDDIVYSVLGVGLIGSPI